MQITASLTQQLNVNCSVIKINNLCFAATLIMILREARIDLYSVQAGNYVPPPPKNRN